MRMHIPVHNKLVHTQASYFAEFQLFVSVLANILTFKKTRGYESQWDLKVYFFVILFS